jgi:hypothetical protein
MCVCVCVWTVKIRTRGFRNIDAIPKCWTAEKVDLEPANQMLSTNAKFLLRSFEMLAVRCVRYTLYHTMGTVAGVTRRALAIHVPKEQHH